MVWMGKKYIGADLRMDPAFYKAEEYASNRFGMESGMRLDELAEQIVDGSRRKFEFVSEGIPFLRISNLTPSGISRGKLSYLDPAADVEHKAVINEGDVLIAKTGSKTAIVDPAFAGAVIGPDIIRIRFKDMTTARAVAAYLNSEPGRLAVQQISSGSIIPKVGVKEIGALRVPLASDHAASQEQYLQDEKHSLKIKELYDRWNDFYGIDSERYERQRLPDSFFIDTGAIELSRWDFTYYQLRQSIAYQDLQERRHLEEWLPLEKVAEIKRSTVSASEWIGRTVCYISLSDVPAETFIIDSCQEVLFDKVSSRARYRLDKNDVLLGCIGPSIGEKNQSLAIVEERWVGAIASSVFTVVQPGENDAYYLLWCMQHPLVRWQMHRLARGQWQKMLAISDVGNLLVPWLEADRQREISGVVKSYIEVYKDQKTKGGWVP